MGHPGSRSQGHVRFEGAQTLEFSVQNVDQTNHNCLGLFGNSSLTDYIQIRNPVYLPHTAGRYANKQFRKAQMPIVERLVNRLGPHESSLKQRERF